MPRWRVPVSAVMHDLPVPARSDAVWNELLQLWSDLFQRRVPDELPDGPDKLQRHMREPFERLAALWLMHHRVRDGHDLRQWHVPDGMPDRDHELRRSLRQHIDRLAQLWIVRDQLPDEWSLFGRDVLVPDGHLSLQRRVRQP